jgi:pimeloyl-ACP methyl ester carboxylesterase
MPTTEVDGAHICYEDRGSGEPAVLCLTGWCSSKERYEHLVPLLARHRRTLAFDWRGHGVSQRNVDDFGQEAMVSDALGVIEDAGFDRVVPVAASHSGWVAIELRRRLGAKRVPNIVHMDWMVVEPSERYMDVIRMLQSPETWPAARDKLFQIWQADTDSPEIRRALDAMNVHDEDMWMRSGRVIEGSYVEHGSPLRYLSELDSPPPVLHVYGQPRSEEYLAAQREFASEHDWFHVERVGAHSHFSMIETPREVADAIERFVDR